VSKHFVSEPIVVLNASAMAANRPELPSAFRWRNETLEVKTLRSTWRSSKADRGDVYLKRHWYEFETLDGRIATVYFDRAAGHGQARWWLYAIDSGVVPE
jgi:hypothetical protein